MKSLCSCSPPSPLPPAQSRCQQLVLFLVCFLLPLVAVTAAAQLTNLLTPALPVASRRTCKPRTSYPAPDAAAAYRCGRTQVLRWPWACGLPVLCLLLKLEDLRGSSVISISSSPHSSPGSRSTCSVRDGICRVYGCSLDGFC